MDYHVLQRHYESCLRRHGDSHLGVDWPKAEHVPVRNAVMLDVADRPGNVLDFGCGLGSLLPEAEARGHSYHGVDISPLFIGECRRKFPGKRFDAVDILVDGVLEPADYVIANGVFTEKRELSDSEMERFFQDCLAKLFPLARRAVAFNVMSAHVDYRRADLFHVGFDRMAELVQPWTRHYRFRADYGLYEYTVYLYRVPTSESFPERRPPATA